MGQHGKTQVAVIPGDGIGKEVVPEGLRVLDAAARRERRISAERPKRSISGKRSPGRFELARKEQVGRSRRRLFLAATRFCRLPAESRAHAENRELFRVSGYCRPRNYSAHLFAQQRMCPSFWVLPSD